MHSETEISTKQTNWNHLLILAAVCFGIYFLRLGSFGFIDRADAYYSEGAREMLESGQFLIPQLNYQTFYDKPIFFYWLQILSYCVFGISEFSARFFSAVCAVAMVFATYFFGRRFAGSDVGLKAALILASSPMTIGLGRQGLTDMTFAALLSTALFLTQARLSGAKRWVGLFTYFFLGLAVLTKGPLGLVLYGAIIGVFFISTIRSKPAFWEKFGKLDLVAGSIIFLAVAVPWYVVAANQTNGFWTEAFILKGNIARFGGRIGHSQPHWWFFFPVLIYGFFPWFSILPAYFFQAISRLRGKTQASSDELAETAPKQEVRVFLWCWFIVMLAIFSASKAKLHTYVLPFLPAMSLLVALCFHDWCEQWKTKHTIAPYLKVLSVLLAEFGAGALIVAALLTAGFQNTDLFSPLPTDFRNMFVWLVVNGSDWMKIALVLCCTIFGIGFLLQCGLLLKGHPIGAIKIFVGSVVCAGIIGSQIGFDLCYQYLDRDLHSAVGTLQSRKDAEVALFKEFRPSVMFYLKRPIDTFFIADQLSKGNADSRIYVVLRESDSQSICARCASTQTLSHVGEWMVIEARGVTLHKVPGLDEFLKLSSELPNPELATLPFRAGVKTRKDN